MNGSKTLREVCNSLGVSRRAVQGYEKMGLVCATSRNKYGHLLYDEQSQQRIARIKLYQQLGFKVKEIKPLIDAPGAVVKPAVEEKILRLKEDRLHVDALIEKAYELLDVI